MLVGFIRDGVYYRIADGYDPEKPIPKEAPILKRAGTSVDYKPGDTEVNSRASYDRRDTKEQVDILFERDNARMRGDLDAAARAEHVYNESKRVQYKQDPEMREQMLREWPREREADLPLPHLR